MQSLTIESNFNIRHYEIDFLYSTFRIHIQYQISSIV